MEAHFSKPLGYSIGFIFSYLLFVSILFMVLLFLDKIEGSLLHLGFIGLLVMVVWFLGFIVDRWLA